MVTEQLHRDHGQQRAEELIDLGHRQQGVEEVGVGALGGHADQLGIAGLSLLGVGEHLLEHQARHGDRHHRHPGIEQGDRPMLHFAGRVALGVDVADLLELQGAFQGNRVVDAPAQEDHVLGVGEQVGQVGAALVVVEHQLL